jgi:hypothetical protein
MLSAEAKYMCSLYTCTRPHTNEDEIKTNSSCSCLVIKFALHLRNISGRKISRFSHRDMKITIQFAYSNLHRDLVTTRRQIINSRQPTSCLILCACAMCRSWLFCYMKHAVGHVGTTVHDLDLVRRYADIIKIQVADYSCAPQSMT